MPQGVNDSGYSWSHHLVYHFKRISEKDLQVVDSFRREFLINIEGLVRPRPTGTVNKKHVTGEVEVLVEKFEVVNKCAVLPFDIDEEHFRDVNEELRLEYRYLDLRRPKMQKIFMRRHKMLSAFRRYFDEREFVEVETPFIAKSTPEGARDMLVPSRKHKGSFYALPQSPQLFKQLLMVAGFEKYYQLVKCFRDEDSRKDRQLEFTQLDMEISFVEFDEFKKIVQGSLIEAMKVYDKKATHADFEVIEYADAMDKYGSDKPDLRIKGLELVDISDIAKKCSFSVFSGVVKSGGLVKGLNVKGGSEKLSRKEIDKLIVFSQEQGAKGLAWMKVVEDNKIESSIAKFFSEDELKEICSKFSGKKGDLLLFIADKKSTTNDVLDALRRHLAEKLDLFDKTQDKFAWITNFPLFTWSDEENRIVAEHSPFTMPNKEAEDFIMKNIKTKDDILKHKEGLLKLKGDCYDVAMNGIEIASGALRIYKPELQKKIFVILEMSDEQIERQFGWFIKAYNYGAPMHRGFAFGIDRIAMLFEDESSIREVIAFPKNKTGYCPLTHSPSEVDEEQLKELSIKVDIPKKEE